MTRLLVTVAHPDDESFGCGSLLAHATARGIESVVLCATRGDAGECPPDIAPETLGAVREQELRNAAALLGVGRVIVLDHGDSGLNGPTEPGTLVAAPVATVAGEVAAAIEDVRPDILVTLDGSDGHRDHVAIRDATLAAIKSAKFRPARTYVIGLSRSSMQRWVEHMRTQDRFGDYTAMAEIGTPDDEFTTKLDVREYMPQRWAAIHAHASQVSPFEGLPPELQEEFLGTDWLRRVDPPWTGGALELDPFA